MPHQPTAPSFTDVFLAYRPKLIGLLMRLLRGRRDDVDDVLQEVWIRGAKGWPPRDMAHARTWLGTIAVREVIARSRRAKRRPVQLPLDMDAIPLDAADPGPSPDDLAAHAQLRAAIASLESRFPKLIESLRLVRLEGRTYREAARALGIAEGTVKCNVHRITERLRESLTPPKAA